MICRTRWLCPVYGALALSLLALTLAGCVSPKERFERARNFESEGRYADAAYAYVKVLEDESDFPNARRRLFDAAQTAIDRWMEEARAVDEDGRHERAVVLLDEVRNLQRACQRVAVDMPLPDGYASFRDGVERRAAESLMAEADAAAQAGDWAAANRSYERAREYADSSDLLDRIDERQSEVLLGWSDADVQRGHFQAAYRRAARIFELLPDTHPLVDEAESLRATAVERGTRPVAFLPLWRTDAAARSLSRTFLDDLNDILYSRYWGSPPPFIASAEPVEVQRTMRRYGLDRDVLSRQDAAEVGRGVGAAFVVTGDVTEFAAVEEDVEEDRVEVAYVPQGRGATSGRGETAPDDTVYVRRTYDLVMTAVAEYRVVDPRTGRVLGRGAVEARADGEVVDGRFPGDWRNLDLSGAETDLFDPDVLRRREQDIENRLLDRLADLYAQAAFDEVLQEID